MKKKEQHTGTVKKIRFPNKGMIADIDGIKDEERLKNGENIPSVTVKNVLPGQEISFIINKKKSGRFEGYVSGIIKKSPLETEDYFCKNGRYCGGCTYQTLTYKDQLELKVSMVKDLLERQVKEDGGIWEDTVESPEKYSYRNKMEYSFGDEFKGGPMTLGLHKRGSLYDVLTCDDCRLVHDDFNVILKNTLDYCTEKGLPVYNKNIHEGYLRHLLLRRSAATGGILIHMITSSQVDHDFDDYKEMLLALPLKGKIEGIIHITNDKVADAVNREKTHILYGCDHIMEKVLGLDFKVSSFSFFQTNTLGAEKLYSAAREYIDQARGSGTQQVVYDLYTGTGTIAQLMAPTCKRVYGVEIIPDAVESAMENAALNALDNCTFICDDVLNALDNMPERPDFIVLDPPREGVNPKALKKICEYGVENIVYISCKPTSLKKDLGLMRESGYRIQRIRCVDMFPWTGHVETVCCLYHQKKDFISVPYEPKDDGYLKQLK